MFYWLRGTFEGLYFHFGFELTAGIDNRVCSGEVTDRASSLQKTNMWEIIHANVQSEHEKSL